MIPLKSNNNNCIKYIPIQRDESETVIRSCKSKSIPNEHHHHTFVVLDEDQQDYTNTPKKISTSTPKQDEFESERQQQQCKQKILFPKVDLFNCDQYPPLEMMNNEPDLIGQIFLADSQKNSMLSMINSNDNHDNKSSSCDKLDLSFRRSSTDNKHHHSENNLLDISKNDLSGIGHLKEEQQPNEHYDGMIDRFRKKFSLRITRSADNSPKHNKISNDDDNNYKIDINQNKIHFDSIGMENSKYLNQILNHHHEMKYSPRETTKQRFMSVNRKSSRKISRKHGRLKRSHTQPLNINDDDDNVENKKLLMNTNEDPEIFTKCLNDDDDNHKRVSIFLIESIIIHHMCVCLCF
ncbi:hypothetical protein BLA29_006316 [Euroglyphus maynei]|uniref:Uncharacterized protein n=1 Tax=Euroglyphus maynei TaxID=6958 RepID=A0A1Y3AQF3_EURMA|nr:hypothetical protein BLA29_006316 [Euroglyphus maynei]